MIRFAALVGSVLLLAGALGAQTRAKKPLDPDLKEMRDYRLNLDVVQRFVRAADAIGKDPVAKKCFEHNSPGNAPSLDAGEKLMKDCPASISILSSTNLKPREFLIITAAIIGDVMAVGMKRSGTIKEYPETVSPENAAFVEQNYDKLQTLLAPVMGGGK